MSLKDCVDSALAQGQITKEEADALKKRYDNLARRILDPTKVKGQIMAELQAEAQERQRRALLTEQTRKQLVTDLEAHRSASGERDLASAFMWMHEHFGEARFRDAEHTKDAIIAAAHTKLNGLLHEFRRGVLVGDLKRTSKLVGSKSMQARMDNVVRELFGQSSGDDAAKALAKAWEDVAEDLRVRFNEKGGNIGKLDKWGLPQGHNQEALLEIGREKWVERMMQPDTLDRDRMVSQISGKPLSDDELKEALGVVWDRVTTDGWSDREVSGVAVGKGSLWSQHADHRFLHFKTADAWMAYARDFGNPDPYHAMMSHISLMARDIAHMEVFGPNPNVLRTYVKNYIRQRAYSARSTEVIRAEIQERISKLQAEASGVDPEAQFGTRAMSAADRIARAVMAGDRAGVEQAQADAGELISRVTQSADAGSERARIGQELTALFNELDRREAPTAKSIAATERILQRADDMWALQRGTLNAPVDSRIANVLGAVRNLITASSLGSAQLSAVSDLGFGAVRRGFVGMARQKSGVVRTFMDTIKYIGPENRQEAVRSGLILDSALRVMYQQARYAGSMDTRTITGFLADRTISLQGLSAWTQAGKHSFGMSMQGMFADNAGTGWAGLPPLVRETLTRHGFDAGSWDAIRGVSLYEPQAGAKFLRPNEIRDAAGRELAERYTMMLLRETRYAVPESSVRSQSLVTTTRPGTVAGELARSFAQFKGFGVAVVLLHIGHIAREIGAGNGARGAQYAGALLLTGTVLGAFAMALKDIAAGRDVREWTDEKTYLDPNLWGAALLQSGGLGIYGDFLFSQTNRFGGGLTQTVAGPLWQRVDNLRNLTVGNMLELAQGKETKFGKESVRFLRENTPMGSLWYARLAYERVVLDQLQIMLDADAHSAFRRQMQNRKRDYKQDFWWQPGTTAPQRGPNVIPFPTR